MNLRATLGWGLAVSCFTSCDSSSSTSAKDVTESSWHADADARFNEQKNKVSATSDTLELLAEDSFETSDSHYLANRRLFGQRPVVLGFKGGWLQNVKKSITSVYPDGLEYTNLKSAGGRIGLSDEPNQCRNGRRLATSYTDSSKGVVYMSFLFKIDNIEGDHSYRAFELHDSSLTNSGNGFNDTINRKFALGVHLGDFGTLGFGFRADNDFAFSRELVADRNTNVNLFVLKFELSDKRLSDSVTVWMNPSIELEGDPAGGVSVSGFDISFDTVTLARFGGSATSLDEIRIGNTYSVVTPTK